VLALVRKARRRIVQNHAFGECANAASAALAAFILLLVLGTQILNWYWVVLLPAAAIAAAVWRIRRRTPSLYTAAQTIDRRMRLADSLSTAWFYQSGHSAAAQASPELRRLQLAEAERLAAEVDVRRAVPYHMPRAAYATGALFLVASSVFALRYGLTDRLDLKQPLAQMIGQRLGYDSKDQRAQLDRQRDPNPNSDDSPSAEDGEQTPPADAAEPEDAAESADQPDEKSARADQSSKSSQDKNKADEDGQADSSEQPEGPQENASQGNPKDGKDPQSGSQNAQNQQGNQSLLSKMKEAMQNLLSSMQPQNSQQQSASNQNGKGSKGQQGAKQQAKGEKTNSASSDAQDQQSADAEQGQNQQSQSNEPQDSPLANKQPGSGAGNRDGAKDIKQAQQLAAMGKISEIIGKRSANVTGESTVDVQNTSQQLRTGYQNRQAEHSQAGAEINRDEVPVALESYVEQYFEQVRKQPAPKK
jgi:hypothetical protein